MLLLHGILSGIYLIISIINKRKTIKYISNIS